MKPRVILKSLLYAVEGVLVGIGAILPGVSGGVLCVAFGIYEPMMALLTHPVKSFKASYSMWIPFLTGWALGFVFLAKAVQILFDLAPQIALLLFFGLICGTLPGLFQTAQKRGPDHSWTPFTLSLALAYLLFHLLENGAAAAIAPSFSAYLFSGLLWGLSLIIPGLSSSSVLIFLGLYAPLTAGIGALDFTVIAPFLIGVAGSVLLFARLAAALFDRHCAVMSQIVLGFVIASGLKILPASFETWTTGLAALGCFAAGFALARAMDRAKEKRAA